MSHFVSLCRVSEAVEAFFYMWRFTHDQKYRDWGWEVAQSIFKHCRTPEGAYAGITDVTVTDSAPHQDDMMQSFFLAETLKYLYLLFAPDELLPLDEWVFNTEAHPFRVFKPSKKDASWLRGVSKNHFSSS